MDKAKDTLEDAKARFGHAVVGLQNLRWQNISEQARKRLEEHPKLTAFVLLSILIAFCPFLVVIPFLTLLGFGGLGPVAGSLAAAHQSANGATTGFRVLQSARMAGYGPAVVNSFIQVPAVVGAAMAEIQKWSDAAGEGQGKEGEPLQVEQGDLKEALDNHESST
ncbi:uncharacterized protein LTR77_000369 [Saxophila tyrrhenica]|uniref:Uncharacterized protein n=1 Tax=Saxophila tyrrhenica TaxID=1690608 RepID=A0AAV9PN31_9PEZI|nr:hypothetical protein LTR77_000369 [Saxophila tyrrhenica]